MGSKYRQPQDIGVITITDDVCFGKPRLKGTKVPTRQIYRVYERDGVRGVLDTFPQLEVEDIKAAITYENRILGERNEPANT